MSTPEVLGTAQNEFSQLHLGDAMTANLKSLGYHQLTPIQRESLPAILMGGDVLAQAKTGSGKTAAFGIGLLLRLNPEETRTTALVLCPTRELAGQVKDELKRLARHMANVKILSLCGGSPIRAQMDSLYHGAHVVVGTPGRILDHLDRGTLDIRAINTFVLDEADRMLDMGFQDTLDQIVSFTPGNHQTLLFSATYPPEIEEISGAIQKNPTKVKVETEHTSGQIDQTFVDIGRLRKPEALVKIISHLKIQSALIFCQTKQQCRDLTAELSELQFSVDTIHGDLEQKERDQVLTLFANGSLNFLIATDVAARGIDIKDLEVVVNFELSRDPEVHVHRIGRTGRQGNEGMAISLYNQKNAFRVEKIEAYMKRNFKRKLIKSFQDYAEPPRPPKVTICMDAGKKHKIRPGDILGALTSQTKIPARTIGNINIFPFYSYIAVDPGQARAVLKQLVHNPVKGKRVRARVIGMPRRD